MSALSPDQIAELLKKPESKTKVVKSNPVEKHSGPLDVLIQSGYCVMCLRQDGPKVRAMYTVNSDPLCTPHAMYVLSCICVENGYKVQIEGNVSDKSSSY